jgi:membrane protease YdiL (CAAX protease family)
MTSTLGLRWCPLFYRDRLFHLAMLAGVGFWVGLWLCVPVHPMAPGQVLSPAFFALVIWQPILEEILFRGCLQGQLGQQSWGQWRWCGITVANGCTSLLFALGHGWNHPPLWAAAVLFPSCIFGYCRERYASVYPSMVLHAFYNAGYFGLTGLPHPGSPAV